MKVTLVSEANDKTSAHLEITSKDFKALNLFKKAGGFKRFSITITESAPSNQTDYKTLFKFLDIIFENNPLVRLHFIPKLSKYQVNILNRLKQPKMYPTLQRCKTSYVEYYLIDSNKVKHGLQPQSVRRLIADQFLTVVPVNDLIENYVLTNIHAI